MISKDDVIEFFDKCAGTWDAEMIRSDEKINKILDNVGVKKGSRILDVACGTGVLIPDYLKREVASVTGVDISANMIDCARKKFTQESISFICGDVEEADVGRDFDAVVVYNAFPHFPEPERLIKHLSELLRPGGMLTVAHGMSREKIDSHHNDFASKVSLGLMHEDELKKLFGKYLEVTTVISDENMYQVVGIKG